MLCGNMNAKHSAILLSGLLLLMIGIALAQSANSPAPTCPPVADEFLQKILQEQPEAWARADWNAKTARWEVDCSQIDALANMAGRIPSNAGNTSLIDAEPVPPTANTPANASRRKPARRPGE